MPTKPLTPCRQPGCPHLTDHPRGYCKEHLPDRYRQEDAQRGTASQRGYDARWRRASKLYLKANPLCVLCLKDGITTAAVLVDHIIPHKGDYQRFWDESNWQSLCATCHNKKTGGEGAFGRNGKTYPPYIPPQLA